MRFLTFYSTYSTYSTHLLLLLLTGLLVMLEFVAHDSPLWGGMLLLELALLGSLAFVTVQAAQAQQQAEAIREKSEQQYRLLAEHAGEVVWAVDIDGNTTYISPSIYSLRGFTREEMLALSWEAHEACGLNPRVQQEVRLALAALRTGRPCNNPPFVSQQRHCDGRMFWTETTIDALYDEEGAPIGLRMGFRDISKRVKAEEALRRSEERFARMVHSNPAGIALSRIADGGYLDANDAYLEIVGYAREELVGNTSTDLRIVTPTARQQIVADLLRQGYAYNHDLQITNKQGRPVDVRFAAELLEIDGAPALLSTVIDISTSKRLECELRELNAQLRRLNEELERRVAQRTAALQATLVELQRAMALRDEFMAMISHELRTPLAGVLTMAELLQEQVGGALAPRQLIYVANIQNSGERLLGVVNSILSYTRLLAGDVPLQPAPCELAALLDTAAHHARDKALAKNQIVSTGVTPPDLTLMSDAEALIQVLERLLDNAVKFTPAGGQLGVTAQLAAPNTVEIAVWDSGPGLGEADLNDLVKPLTQGDGRLARSHEGIGMGLAYVHQLLLLLGGTLGYGANPGGGSRFVVTLPQLAPAAASVPS